MKIFDKFLSLKKNWIILLLLILLISVTLLTTYEGSTDVGDYSDVAKYFSGDLNADIRSSHSYLYGFLVSPLLSLFDNFLIFKILSLIFLLLLTYSAFWISGKNKKIFWLMILSPVVWYMAPWINSIQLSSLLFLWAYFFIKKYDKTEKIKSLILSGILMGLSWGFWDGALFLLIALFLAFFYNKKFYHSILFVLFLFVGLLPKLILDNYLFNFAFIGILRYLSGIITAAFFQGVYGTMGSSFPFVTFLSLLLFLPFFTYKLFSKEDWRDNKKTLIFLFLSFLILLKNPQIRYLLLLTPIILLELIPKLTEKQFRKQIAIFSVISLLVIIPYAIQINYSTNIEEFSSILSKFNNIEISENKNIIFQNDIKKIVEEFPEETFIVGNENDNFQKISHLYWGDDVKEFVSIEDYNLFLNNQTILFEKTFMPIPNIQDRRQIWISGGMSKNTHDNTDYSSIKYGIGIGEPIDAENFSLIRKYDLLYLSEKNN
ncbi:MAG: EpsG family protein [Candidatus Nanoarchaeia archaeon]|nr:EpsG family protein [Candidatus Nanoarchaeia archaeon]MDD5358101.1 EpsG family protein [Candidatus Nanoarchaeia archaeon]MDD5589288.1 EpsG family protein [Candidatus Nanoarchaeia archaeon]